MQFRSFLLGHTHTSNGSFWPTPACCTGYSRPKADTRAKPTGLPLRLPARVGIAGTGKMCAAPSK